MVLEGLVSLVTGLVSSYSYAGVFLAMLIETVIVPLPSELIMPLAGYLASLAGFGYAELIVMIIAGTVGTTLGATIIYYISLVAGRPVVLKYGKYVLVDEKKLSVAERWFDRHGKKAVFIGRMAPGIRELVSVPAGLSKMDLKEFLVFTFAGSLVWVAVLGSMGYLLGAAWGTIEASGISDLVAAIIIIALAAYFLFRILVKRSKKKILKPYEEVGI